MFDAFTYKQTNSHTYKFQHYKSGYNMMHLSSPLSPLIRLIILLFESSVITILFITKLNSPVRLHSYLSFFLPPFLPLFIRFYITHLNCSIKLSNDYLSTGKRSFNILPHHHHHQGHWSLNFPTFCVINHTDHCWPLQ